MKRIFYGLLGFVLVCLSVPLVTALPTLMEVTLQFTAPTEVSLQSYMLTPSFPKIAAQGDYLLEYYVDSQRRGAKNFTVARFPSTVTLQIPHFSGDMNLVLSYKGEKIGSWELSTCNFDLVCNAPKESYALCPSDCELDVCRDSSCGEEAALEEQENEGKKNVFVAFAAAFLLIVFLSIVAIVRHRRKANGSVTIPDPALTKYIEEQLANGYSKEQIISLLVQSGYDSDVVMNSMKTVNGRSQV